MQKFSCFGVIQSVIFILSKLNVPNFMQIYNLATENSKCEVHNVAHAHETSSCARTIYENRTNQRS